MLAAQTALYNAQLITVNTRLARLTNLVDLYGTLGGGWIERTGDVAGAPEDIGPVGSPSPSPWKLLETGELGRTIRANAR